jgi:type I restriction enzyme, S subunit
VSEVIKLKHVARIRPSNVDKKTADGERGVRLCNYTDVYYNDVIRGDLEFMSASATADQVRQFELRSGDVLITKDSETADDIAIPAFIAEDLPGVLCGYHLSLVRPHRDRIDPKFLFWCMASTMVRSQAENYAAGITRVGIRSELVGSLLVPYLPIERQRGIASYLDVETSRIDALIAKKMIMVDLLQERRDRLVEWLVLPHLDHRSRSLPSDVPRDSEVDPRWTTRPMGILLRRITYGFTNPMPTADEGPYMITANDIGDGEVKYADARRTTKEAYASLTDKSRPEPDDVLLTKDGSLGRVALLDRDGVCINQSIALLRSRQEMLMPALLAELLQVPVYRDALIFQAGGTTIKHLYISRVVKQRLSFPHDLHDQAELLDAIRAVRREVADSTMRLRAQIGLLREHRQALITAAVAGEVEVPGAAA